MPWPPLAAMSPGFLAPFGWALVGAVGGMVVLWGVARRIGNAALVDVGWTAFLGLAGVAYALIGSGDPARRGLLGLLVGLWSLRLTLHLLGERILGREEEGRYRRLRQRWGERADGYLLLFFLAQALLVVLLSLPFRLAAQAPAPFPSPLDVAAAVVWLVALAGETVADRQLARFRADPESPGRVCRVGLWRWSRHPNYFFEWLVWCAYGLLALNAPWGVLGLVAPLLMLVFVLRITGIPPTEAQMLRTRGDAYRRYQQSTSAFVPWPPREEAPE